ncbi:MAG TPA: hypothetical protein VMH41_16805 [Mycobacteriales bacterium]|nr:hypothetical protein [Mycobacteriales bacterium]
MIVAVAVYATLAGLIGFRLYQRAHPRGTVPAWDVDRPMRELTATIARLEAHRAELQATRDDVLHALVPTDTDEVGA